jgi:hypothetical protein
MSLSCESFWHEAYCCCDLGFARRNCSENEVATRRYLGVGIVQLLPVELLLGAIAPSVVAGMLRFTVVALQKVGSVVLLKIFLVVMAFPALKGEMILTGEIRMIKG